MGGVSGNNDEVSNGGRRPALVFVLIPFTSDRGITWGCISIRERDDGIDSQRLYEIISSCRLIILCYESSALRNWLD